MNKSASLPAHTVDIRREACYADVTLLVGGRPVAHTTMSLDTRASDVKVVRFVAAYFHVPGPRPSIETSRE